MKRSLTLLFIFLTLATGSFARSFDGTEKLYLNAGAVSWWTNDNAVQRAVLDNGASVIGVWESSVVYAFTIPAGEYTTIRFERASSAEASAWNKTGNIPFDATLNLRKTALSLPGKPILRQLSRCCLSTTASSTIMINTRCSIT